MRGRAAGWIWLALFAVALGHLAWNTLIGPAPVPDYLVGGEVQALLAPPPARQLYVRRLLYLSQRPRHAWIQVLAQDQANVYVNGKFLDQKVLQGFPVALIRDLAPLLQQGPNVIAISTEQSSIVQPPRIAVQGAYTLSDGEHPFQTDSSWRYSTVLERTGRWWFETAFDDRAWPAAEPSPCFLRAKVKDPPDAIRTPGAGSWITPDTLAENQAAIVREFEVGSRPRQAWLRLTTSSPYRLAVNGIPLDQQESQLGTTIPTQPVRRAYDITPVVKRGRNVLALVVTRAAGLPHLLADLEVLDTAGNIYRVASDGTWRSRPGLTADWSDPPLDSSLWQPCRGEAGDLDIPPWLPRHEPMALDLPWLTVLARALGQLGVMAVIGLVMLAACQWLARNSVLRNPRFGLLECGDSSPLFGGRQSIHSLALGHPPKSGDESPHSKIVYLVFVLPTLALASGLLATFDPRVPRQAVYRELWVWLALLSVPLQWGLLALAFRVRRPWFPAPASPWRTLARKAAVAITLAGILGAGCWLRFRDLTLEPMQWDEVENYQAMRGLLERGFPSHQAHPDVPVEYTHTSELVMVSMGLVACGTDSDRLIVRLPGAVWSTLTILLIFFVGRRLFHTSVGLTAASLLALSPVCIAMSNFGRYFGLFQFFTLLTVYLYWLTLQGNGPIHRRTLWLTAGSFLVMFLSWEATALVAPGMIVAALVQRRGRLRSVVWDLQVWAALVVVGLVVVLQYTHQVLQKTQFLWYGTSLSDVDLQPMWRYPVFQPLYYLWYTSWSQDALLPALGFGGACLLALRHGFRKPVRFLLLIHLTTALLMASVLSALAWRYVHHLIPLLILLASAAIVALARAVVRLARQPNRRGVGPAYAWGLGAGLVATFVVLGSGLTLQLADLLPFRLEGYGVTTYKFPYMGGAADYLRDHLQPGDAVLALDPFQVRHLLGPAAPKADLYWPESVLLLPATLADHGTVPIDRRDGTVALPDLESIQDLFARSGRVWFVVRGQGRARLDDDPSGRLGRTWFTVPSPKNQNYNTTDINLFLRDNMEVVYEDEQVLVLLRDRNHWPASLRRQQDAAISGTKANYLP